MNCREYCPYKDVCKKFYPHFQGEEKLHHSDCPMAWNIEDKIQDGDIPFCEPPEGEDTDDLEG